MSSRRSTTSRATGTGVHPGGRAGAGGRAPRAGSAGRRRRADARRVEERHGGEIEKLDVVADRGQLLGDDRRPEVKLARADEAHRWPVGLALDREPLPTGHDSHPTSDESLTPGPCRGAPLRGGGKGRSMLCTRDIDAPNMLERESPDHFDTELDVLVLEAMQLIVSELVTNAIRRARRDRAVRGHRRPGRRIEVTDESPDIKPVKVPMDGTALQRAGPPPRRGVLEVLGCEVGPERKVVWAEVHFVRWLDAAPTAAVIRLARGRAC